jgi:hypothetical protein
MSPSSVISELDYSLVYESLLRNRSFGPIVIKPMELYSPPWPLEATESGVISNYGMSESGTILLEFVDFCLDFPDGFCRFPQDL